MRSIDKIIDIISKKKNIIYSYKKAQHELISVLRELTSKEKKEIKPKVLKLMHMYRQEYYNGTENSNNFHLVCAVGFVVLSQKEYAQYGGADERLILPWYCPPWYSDYYNSEQWMSIGYTLLVQYISKGYINPTGNKMALELVNLKSGFSDFKAITLEEHIWTLFKYESEVHLTKRYPKFGQLEWGAKFVELANENKISREKLLSECLLVTTRNFNKTATGFFFDIIIALEPTNTELINLQSTLYLVLQSTHSKPINQTLKYLKRIHKEPNFDIEGFMEQIPLLLSWDIKAVVNGTLDLIDVLIKAYPENKEQLGILATQSLAQEDEALQTKSIKLLNKHKLLQEQTILDEIAIYSDGLYGSTKALLPDIQFTKIEQESIEISPPQRIREDNRIIYPKSFDEMVFFFSQVFEGNSVYDFDIFVYLLPKLHKQLTEENISKLEPIFQRALKYYDRTAIDLKSEIIFGMAQAFLFYGYTFLKDYAKFHKKISKYYHIMVEGETEIDNEMSWRKGRLVNFEKIENTPTIFNIYRHCLILMLNRIKIDSNESPIWIPSHKPCWIEPSQLIERLNNNSKVDAFEFQIAINRTIFSKNMNNTIQDRELKAIIDYAVHINVLNIEEVLTPDLWIPSLLKKNNATDLQLFSNRFQKETHEIDFSQIFNGNITHRNSKNTTFSSHAVQLIRTLNFDTIYSYTRMKSNYSEEFIDLNFILYLFPTLPNFILEALYKTPRVNFQLILPSLIDIWGEYGDNNYLFLARIFTDVDKATRQFTAELWHKATQEGTINHQLLGETLGRLEHNAYAPLKRFTDLIVSSMLNLSTLHNEGLHTLLSAMIPQMNDTPIKGTKKLLEIYLEVLSLTGLGVPDETMEKLEVWGEVRSLKSLVGKLSKGKYI